jgi:hypothetical protein
MSAFETFREKLVCHLARMLGIEFKGQDVWSVWVAIHESCPEAARIASDQWLQKDLLTEHIRYSHHLTELSTDTAIHEQQELAAYAQRWRGVEAQLCRAIAKLESLEEGTYRH